MSSETVRIKVEVDGRDISMNKFVQRIVCNTILAVLGSLRGIESWKKATIELERS